MTPSDIQRLCLSGTEAYLQFLIAERKGVQEIGVARIEPVGEMETRYFKLILEARLFSPDSVSIRLSPPGSEFGPQHFTVVEYDADAKCLLIQIRHPDLDLNEFVADQIKVISDLRFLVQNVRDWFQQHGNEVVLPTQRQFERESRWVDPQVPLDAGQRAALETLLANPLSYVWGPPGTGKTRHVLAAAVLGLVLAGKKVGIYAPTNNALEQALEAVILALDNLGRERRTCLRVGSPSAKFAQQYHEICEVQGLQGQIAAMQKQKGNYVATLHHRRGANVLNAIPELQHQIGKLTTIQGRRGRFCGRRDGVNVQFQEASRKLVSMEEQRRDEFRLLTDSNMLLQLEVESLRIMEERQTELCIRLAAVTTTHQCETEKLGLMEERQREIRRRLSGGPIRNLLSWLRGERAAWKKNLVEMEPEVAKQREVVRQMIIESEQLNQTAAALGPRIAQRLIKRQQLRTKIEKLTQALAELEPQIDQQQELARRVRTRLMKLNRIIAKLQAKAERQLETIRQLQTESEKLNRLVAALAFTNPAAAAAAIASLEAKTVNYRVGNAAIAAEHDALSDAEIRGRIAELDQRIEELKAHALEERIEAASVIGMTLDCHIGRFHDQRIEFDHVFLDEAGYAPAEKALTLLRGNVPLTFIGDHKQLGPVFEMNDGNLGLPHHHAAIVWKKSALFVDDLFAAESAPALVADWYATPEPRLRAFAMGKLRKTFRFGQNLTAVLAECVYQGIDFVAASPNVDLQITCLDAVPDGPPQEKRQNLAEAECIKEFLLAHPEFQGEADGSWIILTPYKPQRQLLRNTLPNARREDRIMTIHASQGREWDTVILSVVDGRVPPNSPWFTDTTNRSSGGLYVMNTAMSRARRHLILVCDKTFWESLPDQLVSRLITTPSGNFIAAVPGQADG